MSALRVLGLVLFDPARGMATAVAARRFALALALVTGTATITALAFAARVDVHRTVEAELDDAGKLKDTTDRELAEQITQRRHVAQVAAVASALVGAPLAAGALAALSALLGWLFGSRPRPGEAPVARAGHFAAACHALLPLALLSLVSTASLLRGGPVAPDETIRLGPGTFAALGLAPAAAHGPARLLGAMGPFGLWAAALWGLGTAAVTGLRRLPTVAVALGGYVWWTALTALRVPG